jgi:hypothetical protein
MNLLTSLVTRRRTGATVHLTMDQAVKREDRATTAREKQAQGFTP